MTEERGYNLFSAANSNTPSMEIQEEEELQEAQIEECTSYILERLSHMEDILDKYQQKQRREEESRQLYEYNLYQWQLQYVAWQKQQEEARQRVEILCQEEEAIEMKKRQEEAKAQEIKRLEEKFARKTRLAYLTLVVEDWDKFYGVADLFDEDRTRYASTPSFLPGDFFALFGDDDDDDDAEIFFTLEENVEVTSTKLNMDNLKGEEQDIVFKMIFFGSLPNGVIVPCEKKVSNEGMVDQRYYGIGRTCGGILGFSYDSVNKFKQKVMKIKASNVEPRET